MKSAKKVLFICLVSVFGVCAYEQHNSGAEQNAAEQQNSGIEQIAVQIPEEQDTYICNKDMAAYSAQFYQDFVAAAYYENHSNSARAFEIYKCLIQAAPDDKSLLSSIAILSIDIALSKQNNEDMLKYIPLYYEADPQNPVAMWLMAELFWSKDQYPAALDMFEKALEKSPEDIRIMTRYMNLLRQQYPDKGVAYIRTLAERYPAMGYWITGEIANYYLEHNDAETAIKFLKEYISKNKQYSEPYLSLAAVYEKLNRHEDLFNLYLLMEKDGLAGADILVKIGAYYTLKNDKQTAMSYFRKAKAADKGNVAAAQFLVLDAQAKEDYESAVKYLQESSAYSSTPSMHIKAAYFATKAGKPQESVQILAEAKKLFPEDTETALYYGLALADLSDYAAAEKVFEELSVKLPKNEVVLFQYAYALEHQKKYKKMETSLKKLLKINPKNIEALNFYGYYLVDKTKRTEEGGKYIKEAVSLRPQEPAFIDSLAWYYYKKGQYKQAYSLLSSIPEEQLTSAEDAEIYLHLALSAQALQHYKEAAYHYQKVLQLQPENKIAAKNLKKVTKNLSL